MIQFFSRYHWRYPRALVYMLQASEYSVRDYFAWLHRVNDFRHVEKRKQLDATPKAIALLIKAWGIVLALYALALVALFFFALPWNIFAALVLVLAAPFAAAYGVAIAAVVLRIVVQRPVERVLLARARATLAQHPATKIAVAGSFGKTSMREIVKTVLAEGKRVAAPADSQNTPIGIARFVRTFSGNEDVLIFELGEYYLGDVRELCELVQPDIGIITGVNEAHLEKFKNLERTADTIFELADYLKDKPVYVNAESAHAKARADDTHILYNRDGAGDWRVREAETGLEGTRIIFDKNEGSISAMSKLLGLHHVGALAAAVDIASYLGLSAEQIKRGIEKTAPFKHRLEAKQQNDGVVLLDDSYNGNPDGVRAVIDFLASLTGGRRLYVTPGLVEMGERAKEVHITIGKQLAEAGIEKVILIRNSVTPYIAEGLQEAGYSGEVMWFDDGPSAFNALSSITVAGDVVVLQNDWPDQYC